MDRCGGVGDTWGWNGEDRCRFNNAGGGFRNGDVDEGLVKALDPRRFENQEKRELKESALKWYNDI